jgi:hypothetical protein
VCQTAGELIKLRIDYQSEVGERIGLCLFHDEKKDDGEDEDEDDRDGEDDDHCIGIPKNSCDGKLVEKIAMNLHVWEFWLDEQRLRLTRNTSRGVARKVSSKNSRTSTK